MLEAFANARLWLANLDPAAPAVTLMLGVFLIIYSIRRWFPRAWLLVEKTVPFVDSLDYRPAATILWKTWQAWPAAVLGAAVTALSTGGSVVGAGKGALLGLAVAGTHELAAAYKGKLGGPKSPGLPMGGLVFLLGLASVFHVSACAPSRSVADVPHDVAIAYAAANAALEVADTAEADYLDSVTAPTQLQIDRAAAIVEKLKQVRAVLVAVHDDLANGRQKLRAAISDLGAAISLAQIAGVNVPDKVVSALVAASGALQ